jgi:hypothetical protein
MTFSQRLTYGMYQVADHFFGRKKLFKDRSKFYNGLLKEMQKHGEGRIMSVERRTDLSREEFMNHYVRKGIPVVMEGAAKDWECVKKWSLEYFKAQHGDDEIILVNQNTGDYPYELTTLADVIDNIKVRGGKYYRFYPLLTRHPEHYKAFDMDWLRARKAKPAFAENVQAFIGAEGSYTPLHNSNYPNLFVQVYGEKKWMIYSNYYAAVSDPNPIRNVSREASPKKKEGQFNPFEPDYSPPYHLYKYVDMYSVHLKPGDVFFNPPFYWHAVQNVTDSIGVGFRWFAPFYAFKTSPLYLLLDLFATKPPIWKMFSLAKKDINMLHLAEVKKLEDLKQKMAELDKQRKEKQKQPVQTS